MRPTSSESIESHADRSSSGRGRGRSSGARASSRGGAAHRREWIPRASPPAVVATPPLLQRVPPSSTTGILPNPASVHIPSLDGNVNTNVNRRGRGRPRHQHPRQQHPVRSYHAPQNLPHVPAPVPYGAFSQSSSTPQLVQEIQDKLAKGSVECMICFDMVRRSAPIWSCPSCFSIFHLNCIKKWARSPTSTDTSAADGHINWRCPGCQSVQLTPANDLQYVCFCGSRRDPPNDLYLTPHSCGEPCGKPLDRSGDDRGPPLDDGGEMDETLRCPHLCVLQCHPGPCPPCKAFAPRRPCPCGKQSLTRRCSDLKTPLTCGQPCDRLLSCGRHRCDRICHVGSCNPCRVLINASCFCKKKMEVVLCGELAVKGEVDELDGIFTCSSICSKTLTCGHHSCSEVCHPGQCGECELLPQRVTTCCCGKVRLKHTRSSCLDPIPTCSGVCEKTLSCGIHHCKDKCHEGDCGPCLVPINQKCRCGSTSRMIECSKALNDSFFCEKPCGRKKNCGRHRCNERCCPLSSNCASNFSDDWDPHLCQMPCEKKLRCGQHSCQTLCHSGHCPPCLETIFSDLSCACGKTSIPPPIPCGTPYPSCPHPCQIPQPCGHPASHTCHFGDCPPCSVPVVKECIGGHVMLRNIPCGSRDIRCNQLCGRTRQCGMHACARTCHTPPCDTFCASEPSGKGSCGQTCGAPRRDCRHTCTAICHPSARCPEQRCEFAVTIMCSCGRITANVPCGVGGSNGGYNVDTIYESTIIQKLPSPLQPVEANGKRVPFGQRKLICDEECAKLERKRVLAEAFDISPLNLDSLHFGDNSSVSELLTDMFRREPKWVISIEERFKFLVLGKIKGGSSSNLRVHVYCPMNKEKRDVVRQMAERWKLSVHAAGWEPKRFLVVHVTSKSKAPARILGCKAGLPIVGGHPPVFDPLVDMDPRLVISFLDLPRDADISALVLRFGGECELVWLNDKNALAVFSDPARAATALRRLDHGSSYHGAIVFLQSSGASGSSGVNAWGGGSKDVAAAASKGTDTWKKAVVSELDLWGGADASVPVWKVNEAPIRASVNRWNVLGSDTASSAAAFESVEARDHPHCDLKSTVIGPSSSEQGGSGSKLEMEEEVDDWEKAYD